MALIGYARVSTEDQTAAQQATALTAAGCDRIVRETASGASRARPALNALLAEIGRGDVLMVVRIDRLARSLRHLLDIIEALEARGAGFRSLSDPIDTTTPQGRFALQILGAVAEFERALIAERTKAGLARAASEGRRGGNPGLRNGDPLAAEAISRARLRGYLQRLRAAEGEWLEAVRRYRPALPWSNVAAIVNERLPADAPRWSASRLRTAARAYVDAGRLADEIMETAPRQSTRRAGAGGTSWRENALTVIASLKRGDPSLTNRRLAALLDRDLGPPKSAMRWSESTVRVYLREAKARGLV
jgi:DNA invertase Pin-like site-specific DNA recombinase